MSSSPVGGSGELPAALAERLPAGQRDTVRALLAQDPRPAYQEDAAQVYGFVYAGLEIRFTVADGVARVVAVEPANDGEADE